MHLPPRITVQLKSDRGVGLADIIVELEVQAGRKNAYYIQFPKTDSSGRAQLTREDFIGQFMDHWEMALMDYDGSIETASPVVKASLFDPSWSLRNRGLALSWPLLQHERAKWSSREQEYEYRISCRNLQVAADPILVNLEEVDSIELPVSTRGAEQKAALDARKDARQ